MYCDWNKDVNFETLKDKVLKSVNVSDDRIVFTTIDDDVYTMFHMQDCCESVYVESIVGDVNDLIGTPSS